VTARNELLRKYNESGDTFNHFIKGEKPAPVFRREGKTEGAMSSNLALFLPVVCKPVS